jgi:hypothetical protein
MMPTPVSPTLLTPPSPPSMGTGPSSSVGIDLLNPPGPGAGATNGRVSISPIPN